MRSQRILASGILLAAAILLVGRLPQAASDDKIAAKLTVPPVAQPSAGRFQMTAAAGQLYLLDTMTGQVWKHTPNGKADEQFFEAKIKEEGLANMSRILGPTYKSLPLSYWMMLLRDGDKEFQEQGLAALAHFGPKASAAMPDLIDMLTKAAAEDSFFNRLDEAILMVVVRVDPKHDFLRSQLKNKDYKVRRGAAIMISVLGEVDPKAPLEGNRSIRVTSSGGETDLEETPENQWRLPGDKEAIPVLIEMLRDTESINAEITYVDFALAFLASFKGDAATGIPELSRLLMDARSEKRVGALCALAAIGPAAKDSIPAIRLSLKDRDAKVQASAFKALAMLGDRESLSALKSLMKENAFQVRQLAVEALGYFKDDAGTTVPILLEVINTPEAQLKAKVLDQDGNEKGTTDSFELFVIRQAYISLGKLGPAAKAAVPELIRRVKMSDERFAGLARKALRQIAPDEAKKIKPLKPTIDPPSPAIPPAPVLLERPTTRG